MKKLLSILLGMTLLSTLFIAPVSASPNYPLIQVTAISTFPESVAPGDNFNVFLTLVNNGDYNAYNTTIDVVSIAGSKNNDLDLFSMSGTGSHIYVGKLPAYEATSATLHMAVSPEAIAKNYNLNIKINTEDSNGNQYSYPETIGLFINEASSMYIHAPSTLTLDPTSSTTLDTTDEHNLSLNISNLGMNSVRGVSLAMSGEGLNFSVPENYFGTFAKDDSDSFSTNITANASGEYTALVTLSYLDSFNNPQTKTQEIHVSVPETSVSSDPSQDPSASNDSNIFTKFIKILFGITI